MDRVNWMLIVTGEVMLVLEAQCLKTFPFCVVLHRLRLSPWGCASSLLANHAASSIRLCFSFPSILVDFLFLVATLNGNSRDFVDPQVLTHHRQSVVALVSAAFVVLVRKDAHDHAIWTVVVVSHLVVTDQHHHHLELVFVEVPAVKIVVVIAHAMHVQLLLFLSHQQEEELGPILVVVQVNLALQEVQEAPEVCQEGQEEHQDHQRR